MKKYFILYGIIALFLQSCVVTEEVHVNKQGELSYTLSNDFSVVMAFSAGFKKELGEQGDFLEELSGKELSLKDWFAALAENSAGTKQQIDSIFLKYPELKEESDNMFLKVTLTDSIGKIDVKVRAANVTDLNKSLALGNEINKVNELDKESGVLPHFDTPTYELTPKYFARKIEASANVKKDKAPVAPEGGFDEMSVYRIKTSFEEKIKSVSNKKAVISPDRKSFTLEYNQKEIKQNPKLLEYKVVFEK